MIHIHEKYSCNLDRTIALIHSLTHSLECLLLACCECIHWKIKPVSRCVLFMLLLPLLLLWLLFYSSNLIFAILTSFETENKTVVNSFMFSFGKISMTNQVKTNTLTTAFYQHFKRSQANVSHSNKCYVSTNTKRYGELLGPRQNHSDTHTHINCAYVNVSRLNDRNRYLFFTKNE